MDNFADDLVSMDYENYSELIKVERNILSDKRFIIQGFSSCLPAYLLLDKNIKRSDSNDKGDKDEYDIIDACSAPGNKTM